MERMREEGEVGKMILTVRPPSVREYPEVNGNWLNIVRAVGCIP